MQRERERQNLVCDHILSKLINKSYFKCMLKKRFEWTFLLGRMMKGLELQLQHQCSGSFHFVLIFMQYG